MREESRWEIAYLVGIVEIHDPTPFRIYVLVALRLSAHDQSRIHVHVVTGKIQRDEQLENDTICGFGSGQKD